MLLGGSIPMMLDDMGVNQNGRAKYRNQMETTTKKRHEVSEVDSKAKHATAQKA